MTALSGTPTRVRTIATRDSDITGFDAPPTSQCKDESRRPVVGRFTRDPEPDRVGYSVIVFRAAIFWGTRPGCRQRSNDEQGTDLK